MNNENPITDDAQNIDAEDSLGNTDSWRAVQPPFFDAASRYLV